MSPKLKKQQTKKIRVDKETKDVWPKKLQIRHLSWPANRIAISTKVSWSRHLNRATQNQRQLLGVADAKQTIASSRWSRSSLRKRRKKKQKTCRAKPRPMLRTQRQPKASWANSSSTGWTWNPRISVTNRSCITLTPTSGGTLCRIQIYLTIVMDWWSQ